MISTTPDDPRGTAEQAFRERMRPLLALADEHAEASELFIDGEDIRLAFGDQRRRFGYADFPGLTPRAVQAAGAAAAVFAGVEFGPHPPARPLLSVKIPPDLRVTYVQPPAADRWHVAVRFLRSRLEGMKIVSSAPADRGRVFFGAWVTIEDARGEVRRHRIVGPDEFDREPGYISMDAPLGRALLGIYDLIGVRWLIKRSVLPRAPLPKIQPATASEERPCLQN